MAFSIRFQLVSLSLLIRSIQQKKTDLADGLDRVTECESRKFPFFLIFSKKTEIYRIKREIKKER
jgi:hypothetical protein